MWDLEDRLRGALAQADGIRVSDALPAIWQRTSCVHQVQAQLAVALGVEFGPAYAALGLRYWAEALAARGRPHLAEFVRGTADLLTPDSETAAPDAPETADDTTEEQ